MEECNFGEFRMNLVFSRCSGLQSRGTDISSAAKSRSQHQRSKAQRSIVRKVNSQRNHHSSGDKSEQRNHHSSGNSQVRVRAEKSSISLAQPVPLAIPFLWRYHFPDDTHFSSEVHFSDDSRSSGESCEFGKSGSIFQKRASSWRVALFYTILLPLEFYFAWQLPW